ncbi:ABC transporter permease [Reyranella sp. CPCC 100927]|uniref:ABC transporter permease n=1 Tax=Reyranella sp. CPCC 100927 TaxID=2599616 RepID=UPI0011B6ABF6|nr:ABC transporter permease [Reyranella sp. CPCC 100927]TWT05621.1 ABC transporter permease [Reyranella sp. CPCC 100927]
MGRYIIVRLCHAAIVLAVVTVLVFVIARLIPGDAIMAAMAGSVDMSDASVVKTVRATYGLDEPLPLQFLTWLERFVTGDWGTSLGTGEPVLNMFLSRLPVTLELFAGATLWSLAIGLPVGLIGALKRNSGTDVVLTAGALLGVSLPSYWEAIVLIYLFAVLLPILPPSGYVPFAEDPLLNITSMILPSFVLGTHSAGLLARYVRGSLLEVLGQDFIRTARAKGLRERSVVIWHALKPAMIPIVTIIGLSWGGMLAGAFFVEVIFALPGLGRMSVDAIFQKDFPVIQATLIAVSVNVLLVNVLVDILYGYLDPRVRIR